MMKVNFRIYFLSVLFAISVFSVQAQMVNKGEMKIEEGTKDVITFFDFVNESTGDFINNDNFHIMKNYENLGKVMDEKGTILFKGSADDTSKKRIFAGSTTLFYNVVFDSPHSDAVDGAAFDLKGEMNIAGEADFRDGIVGNKIISNKISKSLGSIVFWEGATAIGANDNSYVNGMVEKIGKEAFPRFPVGAYGVDNRYYRYAGVSAPKSSETITAEYFLEETDTSNTPHDKRKTSILKIDNNEYWYLTKTEGVMLTLSWDDRTTPNELLKDPKSIHIVHWDINEDKWVDMGGLVDEFTKTVTTRVNGEGIFTLALVDVIQEGEIRVFNAISPNGDGENDRFYVEVDNQCKCFDKLGVKIYNRWGVQVYGSDNYLSDDENTFYGYSNGRAVIDKGTLLSRGTYYYILDYEFTDDDGNKHKGTKVGYLYLSNDPDTGTIF